MSHPFLDTHAENVALLRGLLRVSASFDVVLRNWTVAGSPAAILFIDGMVKDETMSKMMQFFSTIKPEDRQKQADAAGKKLSNVFIFCEEVFDEGQEMLILVTELTIGYYSGRFISRYGCKEYFNHNKELLFYERQKEIIREIENLKLEELKNE